MKKKIIVGTLFLMMVSTMVVSASNIDVKENNIKKTVVVDEVDVPVWGVGDSWTYNENYNQFGYRIDGTPALIWYHNCTSTYTVINDTGDTYTVELTSENNEGSILIGMFRLQFTPYTKLYQKLEHRKTDLAYVSYFHQEKGPVFWLIGKIGLPMPAYYKIDEEDFFEPANELIPFPLSVGKTGTFASYINTGYEKMSLYFGLIKLVDADYSNEIPARDYTCNIASITVPAGTFEAYNISRDMGSSQNFSYSYYVPEVGFDAKWVTHTELDSGEPYTNVKAELVSTTYTP